MAFPVWQRQHSHIVIFQQSLSHQSPPSLWGSWGTTSDITRSRLTNTVSTFQSRTVMPRCADALLDFMWPLQQGLVSLYWHQRSIASVVLTVGCQSASVFKSGTVDCRVSITETTSFLTQFHHGVDFYCSIQMQYQGLSRRCRHFEYIKCFETAHLHMCIRHSVFMAF